MFHCFFILSVLLFQMSLFGSEESYKIVYLNSGPRSLSTVFLRMMESRGDFAVFNEPTLPVYVKMIYQDPMEGVFRKDSNATFEQVKETLYRAKETSHVFVKDMSYSSHTYLMQDSSFMEDPSVYFIFLVRDPHHMTISFYKKAQGIMPGFTNVIGLGSLWEEYEAARDLNPNGAKIILTEQLYTDPRETMTQLCEHLGIPFLEEALTWKVHGDDFRGHQEWNEQKVGDQIQHWHGQALSSTKMGTPSTYEVDEEGNPTFSEVADDNDRAELEKVYEENVIYYRKFLEAKENHLPEPLVNR